MMKYKRLTVIALVTILAVSVLLLLTGCPQHIDSLYGVKVVGDGNGGAIIIYENKLGGTIYAQKISPEGRAQWGDKAVLGSNPDNKHYAFFSHRIVGDNSGGAIIAWWVALVGTKRTPVYQVFKLDSDGKRLWQKDVGPVDQLLSDGAGGAILDYG
ncbi:MAG: hypothetical protein PHH57_05065, partial [Candidatus Omnitrophica bacterium]|nr:hypothetical protein [Candidatus Omnitrophota bacterium]